MPASELFLKALIILKKRKDGGLDHYFNAKGNYDMESEFLGRVYGFKDWYEVQAGKPGQLEGFVAVQIRPRAKRMLARENGAVFYVDSDYSLPLDQWKFTLRHQHFEIPGWVHIAEIKKECMRVMPEWAKSHLIYDGTGTCEDGQAIAALGHSRIVQSGGQCWGYKKSVIIQQAGCCMGTDLHDTSTGYIHGRDSWVARGYDNSRLEVFPGGICWAYGSATVILRPDHEGNLGRFIAYSKTVKVYRVKPGAVMLPDQPVSNKDLIPVKFTPEPEPNPIRKPSGIIINEPFNMPVD